MVKSQMSRHGRRRRMWLSARIQLLKRKTSDPCVATTRRRRDQQEYFGFQCVDLDVILDLQGMWQKLDDLMSIPLLSTKLDTEMLAGAVPILTKQEHASHARLVTTGNVLLGQEGNSSIAWEGVFPHFIMCDSIGISEGRSGRGFYATRDLPCGSTVLVEKPVASVLDVETRRTSHWADLPSADTSALTCSIAKELSGSRGKLLRQLMMPMHPKEDAELPVLQTGDEDEDAEEDAELAAEMQQDMAAAFAAVPEGRQIERRIQAVARLNGLGYYTNPEQLCHNDIFRSLTGTGLCLIASAFNHSCSPNVTRYSIGDVLIFRTTAPLRKGEELCISYIESETLCESVALRRQCLNRDFICACAKCAAEDAAGGTTQQIDEDTNYLSVDAQLQAELAVMPPQQRADFCRSLLRGELPLELRDDEEDEGSGPSKFALLMKDSQEIRAVLGLALLKMCCFQEAWEVWLEAARLAAIHGPACDEALGVYVVHAALSAIAASAENELEAWEILKIAASLHFAAFGGSEDADPVGIAFFQRRFAKEVALILELTSDSNAQKRQQCLWARLFGERTRITRFESWLHIKDQISSWKMPKAKQKTKTVAAQGGSSSRPTLTKPKAQVVNGLRVLP